MLLSLFSQFEGTAESLKKFFETLEKFPEVGIKEFKILFERATKIQTKFLIAAETIEKVKKQMIRVEEARKKTK